ncbi:MAG: methyl-accepting chemotaxis protein, partial [Alphaproteobacteria bacterium]|nr:methyl-accepting chemotaxis protein [Alphaproteobacteria bacterium]
MLNRVSVSTLLKSVIATLAAVVVVMLVVSAWHSWTRLAAVHRIAAIADASSYMFTAMHNMRVDRATTARELQVDKQFTAISPLLRETREADMPALKSALVALESVDLPDRAAVVADFAQMVKKLAALQEESAAA